MHQLICPYNYIGLLIYYGDSTSYKFQVITIIFNPRNNSYNYELMDTISNMNVDVTGYNPYNLVVEFVRSLKLIDRLQWKN